MADLIAEQRGPALWLTINREERRNAMSPEVIEGLVAGLKRAHDDPATRVVVITGVGDKAFCAGADLATGKSFKFDYSIPSQPFANLLRVAQSVNVPLVARINGTCMAGGMGLLSMCDMAVAADHALFGLPEVKVGVFPMQVLSVLQRIIPSRMLYEMCLMGEPIRAAEAKSINLVNRIAPKAELDATLEAFLARLLDKAPSAIRRGRYTMRRVEAMAFEESIAFTESQIGLLSMTEDAQEGQLAFREKRKPNWPGR